MLKNALFFRKTGKIAAAFSPEKNPRSPPAAGGSAPDPQVVTLTQLKCYFWALLEFSGIVKIMTYYLILSYFNDGEWAP